MDFISALYSIPEIIDRVIEIYNVIQKRKRIAKQVERTRNIKEAVEKGDEEQVKKILSDTLNNARKYID